MNTQEPLIGQLHIIIGPMFSGKTTELIKRLRRYSAIGKNVLVINSSKDTRNANIQRLNSLSSANLKYKSRFLMLNPTVL